MFSECGLIGIDRIRVLLGNFWREILPGRRYSSSQVTSDSISRSEIQGAFFSKLLGYSGYSYSCLGITEYRVLLYLIEDWKRGLDHGNVIGVTSMVLNKAFDSLRHKLLYCHSYLIATVICHLQLLVSNNSFLMLIMLTLRLLTVMTIGRINRILRLYQEPKARH